MRWNLWDGTAYMWRKRQNIYGAIYLTATFVLICFGMYVEALLALILAEMRISRKEQRFG